jgi:hypothetical protein
MRLDFKVRGTQGMIANLYGYKAAVEGAIVSEVDRYTLNVQADARARARKDSGKMAAEIERRITDAGRIGEVGWDEAKFTGDGDYPYYYIHELGSSAVSPQPMIGPAHRTHAPVMVRNISAIMRKEAAERSG